MSVELPDRGAPPHPARLLIAIPWRQAGLIASSVLAGVAATIALSTLRPPAAVVGTHVRVQVPGLPTTPMRDAILLQLDLEPGLGVAQGDALDTSTAQASVPAAALRLDDAREVDAFEGALQAAPPAAGFAPILDADLAAVRRDGVSAAVAWRGLVAGLLLGLVLASLRELRGGRMRTPREAEWALGAPVLGAIPTLSAKARAASVGMVTSA